MTRECECGFKFSQLGEFRNCDSHMDKKNQWWLVCPECGRHFKSD